MLIDVHARFGEAEAIRAARAFEPLGVYWWEEPSSREREEPSSAVARATTLRVATGETFHMPGQFFTLAKEGGVSIWQPEPMSLGGFGATYGVAQLARAAGAGSRRTRAAALSRPPCACSSPPAFRTS